MIIHGSYDYRLVAVSVALAMAAAYAALDLAGRVTVSHHRARAFWLAGGATVMGLGIWAMHYVGMLAFSLPVPVLYHYPTVILSLLAAIAASAVALITVSREKMSLASWTVGGVTMGSGIAAMHYIGMAAMRLAGTVEYRWPIVILSVVLAIVISLVALVLAFRVRKEEETSPRKLLSALVMGSAIPLMHYTGMWAARFRASDASFSTNYTVKISLFGISVISIAIFVLLMLAIAIAILDRMLSSQKAELGSAHEDLSHFRGLAEAIPEIVWTATPEGMTDYCNKRWYEVSGLTESQTLGRGWSTALHPDDLLPLEKEWERALRMGATLQTEYRLLDAAKGYRWFLVRATPVRDISGAVVKWFGTCTDIEDQKHNQQILEEQIRDRTEELADANTRLQEEMFEKDVARRRLDEQNEKMMDELTERSKRATMLAKMGELLQSCVSKDEVFAAALGYAPKIFPSSRGALALLDSGRSLAEVVGSWHDCIMPVTVFESSECWALRTGQPHLVVAGDSTARCAHAGDVKNTYLCLPVIAQGQAFGILHFQATDGAPVLADSELSLKTTFAGQVGLSVANIRLREALHAQSIRDALTGLFNRRYLGEMLERETRRAVRAEHGLGVLMLDLDHFKKFNDTYGHDAGDTVLRETASFLTKSVRAEDFVCRFGGEEFVVVLPMADLKASRARAEHICSKLRELTVLHQGQSVGKLTVSVGVAELPSHGTIPKQLLEAADAALYRAKREGRDRVELAEAPLSEEQVAAASAAGI